MFVLDWPRVTEDWKVVLPLYHRGHLSLTPGTTVFLAPVHHLGAGRKQLPEVLGTTIQQSSWPAVYLVSVELNDAPGVLHSILASISRHGGNVLNLDSTSTDQESRHHVELVVDFASLIDSDEAGVDLSNEIEGLLLGDCHDHIVEDAGLGFGIRVRPNATLRRLDSLLKRLRSSRYNSLVQEEELASDGRLTLREPLIHMLSIQSQNGRPTALSLPLLYFISSDTRERLFRITFVPNDRQVVWCSIRHNDRPGALSAITDQIRRSGITILSALNRIQRHQGRSWFEVILSREEWTHPGADRDKEREVEVAALFNSVALEAYTPVVFFDKKVVRKSMHTPPEQDAPAAAWFLARQVAVHEWLMEKEVLLDQPQRDVVANEESTLASKAALLHGIRKVRAARGQIRPTVFISVEFSKVNEARIDIARDCCEAQGIAFDLVKGTKDQPVVREEVLGRISQATHFVGIWAPSEKDTVSSRCSPWLLWELGVASALRLPYGVLVEEGTNPLDYKAIHGERFYYPFSPTQSGSFRSQFTQCLDLVLRSHIVGRVI
jgi:glycine cleavage system regulatory protein